MVMAFLLSFLSFRRAPPQILAARGETTNLHWKFRHFFLAPARATADNPKRIRTHAHAAAEGAVADGSLRPERTGIPWRTRGGYWPA